MFLVLQPNLQGRHHLHPDPCDVFRTHQTHYAHQTLKSLMKKGMINIISSPSLRNITQKTTKENYDKSMYDVQRGLRSLFG